MRSDQQNYSVEDRVPRGKKKEGHRAWRADRRHRAALQGDVCAPGCPKECREVHPGPPSSAEVAVPGQLGDVPGTGALGGLARAGQGCVCTPGFKRSGTGEETKELTHEFALRRRLAHLLWLCLGDKLACHHGAGAEVESPQFGGSIRPHCFLLDKQGFVVEPSRRAVPA